ncbi:ATP-dependent DNA helicase PIF1-like [Lactuca sativa]|uniref:ATP-dependent DNA helicase PIF1-like n=1 Tax=Lactuca sativa TaxID=4236 RepID=UPI0022AE99CE|nr:ATP-dependent DNA helicase PIF1-like [Lactuca sativa]
MRHVDQNISGVFFIDGPGGTGKTFLYKALLANIRARGLIALATATSGVAANNMPAHLEDLHAWDSLNPDQKLAYDEIMRHVDQNISGVFFIDGPGGIGKTFLYKALLANIRARGLIALATATSGVAANNMPGGRTTHSRFGIPLNLDNNSMCKITKQSGKAQILREEKVIIWDEAAMAKRQAVEVVDRTMQDITYEKLPFGGKIMVMEGDFRQVLSVVSRGTRAQIVDSSLQMSPLWASVKRLRLNINMRAVNDPWFSDFLLRVGDGKEETLDESYIRIPDNTSIPYTDKTKSVDALIDAIFPSLQSNGADSKFIISRAILSTKNESVDEINNKFIERFSEIVVGQHAGKRVCLPRIPLCSSDDEMLPFKLKRKQFPIQLSFSTTINKAQGQTIPNVGVYLPESVFSHGQLYVALSRGISRVNTKVLVNPEKTFDNDGIYTSNIVADEVT